MRKQQWWVLTVCSGTLLLGACGTTTEHIHGYLEEAAREEQIFYDQQQPLKEAEEKEAELYAQLIELELKEYDQIVQLADQAVQSMNKRRELLETEKESIENSYAIFEQAVPLFDELQEESHVQLAEKVRAAMEERYKQYAALHAAYADSLELAEALYHLFQEEELTAETLTNHVEKTNEKYEEVQTMTDRFNEQTDTYNEAKRAFYEAMD